MTTGPSTASGPSATGARQGPDIVLLALRGVQFVFALIVLGTIGDVIHSDDNIDGCYGYRDGYGYGYGYTCLYTPPSFKYNMFVGAWTILVVGYHVASAFVPAIYHILIHLAVDALSILFWFSAWVSVAAWLGSNGYIYAHVGTTKGRQLLQAGTVFGAFTDILFVATLVLGAIRYRSNRNAAAAAPAANYDMQQPVQQPPMQQGPIEQKPVEHPAV